MAVPSQEEFQSATEVLRGMYCRTYGMDVKQGFSEDELREMLIALHDKQDADNVVLSRLPSLVWLESQECFRSALRKMAGKRAMSANVAPDIDTEVAYLWQMVGGEIVPNNAKFLRTNFRWHCQGNHTWNGEINEFEFTLWLNSDLGRTQYLHAWLKHFFPYRLARMCRVVSESCCSYFYDLDRPKRESLKAAEVLPLLEKAEKALRDISELGDFGDYNLATSAGLYADRLKRQKRSMENYFPLIERNDKTSRERIFVLDLAIGFKRIFGNPKSSAIVELLQLEGMENELEHRTIERIISGNFKRNDRQLVM